MAVRVYQHPQEGSMIRVTHGNYIMEFPERELSAYLDKIYDDITITKGRWRKVKHTPPCQF